jgi:hypothetical protein
VNVPLDLVAANVNGDGRPDLLALEGGTGAGVWLNSGNGTFGTGSFYSDLNPNSPASAMAVGDLNGDGMPDIVFANYPADGGWPSPTSVTVLQGNGLGNFTFAGTSYPGFPTNISSLTLADVYGGEMDLVAVNPNGGVYVARPNGNDTFGTAAHVIGFGLNTGTAPAQVAVADVNGDGKPDIVRTDDFGDNVCVGLNNGNGTFGLPVKYVVGGDPAAVAVGDVNGDGKADIVTANTNGTVSVLLNNDNGTFAAAQNYAIGGPANSVALGDFNGDGHLDIATTGGTETDVLLNNGNGTFAPYQTVGPAGSHLVAADFNGDGYPDLAEIDATRSNIDVLLNNANWSAKPSFAVAGFPASTTAGVSQSFTVTALAPTATWRPVTPARSTSPAVTRRQCCPPTTPSPPPTRVCTPLPSP